jgi:hypothetical protein
MKKIIFIVSAFFCLSTIISAQEQKKVDLNNINLEFVNNQQKHHLNNVDAGLLASLENSNNKIILNYIDNQNAIVHYLTYRNATKNSQSYFTKIFKEENIKFNNTFLLDKDALFEIGDEVEWRVMSTYLDGRKSLQLYKGVIGGTKQTITLENNELVYKPSTFPNPFTTELNIKFTAVGGQEAYFQVFDLTGKQLYNSQVQKLEESGFVQETLDTSGWQAGIYIVKTFAGNGESSTQKVVKQ